MNAETTRTDTPELLIGAILDPAALENLDARTWERLLSCARRNAVLAYLAERASAAHVVDALPDSPRMALASARTAAARLAQLAEWELDRVRRVLGPLGIPIVALKGVAYVLRKLPHARTRILTDIDILVPRDRIDDAERALIATGWKGTKLDPYDQRYYRRWSHEIPPLQYPGRLLGVDVHHTICPPRSRLRPDPTRFWTGSEPTSIAGVGVLGPADSVLHAAVHLFFDSDFDGRFRELVDLHELVTAFSKDALFWPTLIERAQTLGLGRPLYYALETLAAVLRTPVPQSTREHAARDRPPIAIDGAMKRALREVLTPADPEPWPPANRALREFFYVRSHWLRMPPHALIPHLVRKALRGASAEAQT